MMTQDQLNEMLTLCEDIQEQISIAAELWDMTEFEENALCGIVADAFASRGISMEKLKEEVTC